MSEEGQTQGAPPEAAAAPAAAEAAGASAARPAIVASLEAVGSVPSPQARRSLPLALAGVLLCGLLACAPLAWGLSRSGLSPDALGGSVALASALSLVDPCLWLVALLGASAGLCVAMQGFAKHAGAGSPDDGEFVLCAAGAALWTLGAALGSEAAMRQSSGLGGIAALALCAALGFDARVAMRAPGFSGVGLVLNWTALASCAGLAVWVAGAAPSLPAAPSPEAMQAVGAAFEQAFARSARVEGARLGAIDARRAAWGDRAGSGEGGEAAPAKEAKDAEAGKDARSR